MQALPIITTTAKAWGVSPHMPSMLRALSQKRQTIKDSSRINVCRNCSGEKCAQSASNHCGIEITTSSFYYRGFE